MGGEEQPEGKQGKASVHELPDTYGIRQWDGEPDGLYRTRLYGIMKTTEGTIKDFEPAVERARLQVLEYGKRAEEPVPPVDTNVVDIYGKPISAEPAEEKPPFEPRILSSYQASYDLLNAKLLEQRRKLTLVTAAYNAIPKEEGEGN